MNFTREPIIETVITPREGCKLTIRNSKSGSQEEYFVDAIEVVSFGQSMFFRSQERPKCFLLPVSDYEVIEAKETRVVLKNAPLEGSIKIGGGKAPQKPARESEEKSSGGTKSQQDEQGERPRRRKSLSRRRRMEGEAAEGNLPRTSNDIKVPPILQPDQEKKGVITEKGNSEEGAPVASSAMFRNLFPPPPGLISEKIQQEKYQQQTPKTEEESSSMEPKSQENTSVGEMQDGSFSDFVEEEKEESHVDVQKDEKSPRYHSAPRDDAE